MAGIHNLKLRILKLNFARYQNNVTEKKCSQNKAYLLICVEKLIFKGLSATHKLYVFMWIYAFNQSFLKTIFLATSLKQNNFFNICILILQIQPNESFYKDEIKMCRRIFTSCTEKIIWID